MALLCVSPRRASGEPLRLRADALAYSPAPSGLVILQGRDERNPYLDVEALIWGGAHTDSAGDITVLTLRLREPHGYGEVRGGRFVFTTGAIRPVQIDGLSAVGRTPWGFSVEACGGAPVLPRLAVRRGDWFGGVRASERLSFLGVGASYVREHSGGQVSNEEVGLDLAAVPTSWLDVAGRGAYDVTQAGLAEALLSAAARFAPWRFELFASQRSPSRILPATSLFSVLGDIPSENVGATIRWQAAPRLDLATSEVMQVVGGDLGGNGTLRALLRLDDRGDGSIGLEVRRQQISTARFWGMRATLAQSWRNGFRASTELELVRPDDPAERGALWPWGLVAWSWRSTSGWEIAAGTEAASTSQYRFEATALLRLSRALEVP
jgi:hypothetical protein